MLSTNLDSQSSFVIFGNKAIYFDIKYVDYSQSLTIFHSLIFFLLTDQASNDDAESRFSGRGSPISSSFNESIHGESSLYQSGVSHLRDGNEPIL